MSNFYWLDDSQNRTNPKYPCPTRKGPNCTTLLSCLYATFLPCKSGCRSIPCTFRRKSGANGAALGNYLLPSGQNELLISFSLFSLLIFMFNWSNPWPCHAAWLFNEEGYCPYGEVPSVYTRGCLQATCLGLGVGQRVFVPPALREGLSGWPSAVLFLSFSFSLFSFSRGWEAGSLLARCVWLSQWERILELKTCRNARRTSRRFEQTDKYKTN